MKFMKMALLGAAASLALGGAAFAQDEAGSDDFSFSYNAGVASDYIFRGVSQTDGPQGFGGVDISSGALYAGAWVSNVDFGDDTDAEYDLYVGVKPELGPVAFDLAGMGRDDGGDALGPFRRGFAANIVGLADFLRCTHATASSRFRAGSRHWVKALSQPCINQSPDQIPRWVIFVNFQPPGCPGGESA